VSSNFVLSFFDAETGCRNILKDRKKERVERTESAEQATKAKAAALAQKKLVARKTVSGDVRVFFLILYRDSQERNDQANSKSW